MLKTAIVLYGPPGSGKGTQAGLLAHKFDLIHFDTGRYLESLVHDPDKQSNPEIAKERKLFDGGVLMTPSFVLREVAKEVKRIAKAGWGIVLSGSPRTISEAEKLVPILEKAYKNRLHFVVLEVPVEVSIKRNTSRLMCTICGSPLLTKYYPSKTPRHCPVCAGSLYRRTLDNHDAMKVRIKQYEERTIPIFSYIKKRGHNIYEVSGIPAPFEIYETIAAHIARKRKK